MKHSILIIDDEKIQAEGLKKAIEKVRPSFFVQAAFTEKDIENAIENTYYNVAIVDLRMDNMKFDGIDLIKRIAEVNPFAKIIIVSAYLPEYEDLIEIIKQGKIEKKIEKKEHSKFVEEILAAVDKIISDSEQNQTMNQQALEDLFADAKNETNINLRGKRFENFVFFLFSQMGFIHIEKRQKDTTANETDLVVRNDLNDSFFQKFKPYFLVECKNERNSLGKDAYVEFERKLENTNALSNLGFLVSASEISKNIPKEANRDSQKPHKVIFITPKEIKRLIDSDYMLHTLKKIIDEQVKWI